MKPENEIPVVEFLAQSLFEKFIEAQSKSFAPNGISKSVARACLVVHIEAVLTQTNEPHLIELYKQMLKLVNSNLAYMYLCKKY